MTYSEEIIKGRKEWKGQPRTWTRLYFAAVASLVVLSGVPIAMLCSHQPEHTLVAMPSEITHDLTSPVAAERVSLTPASGLGADGIPFTIARNMLPGGCSI